MLRYAILAALAIGCGGGAAASPPPAAPPPPPAPTEDPNARGAGSEPPPPSPPPPAVAVQQSSKDSPVLRCGPMDSYKYVATDFKCADGSNPFGGNLKAAQMARKGNVGANAQGHIIDLYEVPCPEGPRQVFVDMYGCEKGSKI